jgi:hypothetical protein
MIVNMDCATLSQSRGLAAQMIIDYTSLARARSQVLLSRMLWITASG